MAHKVTIGDIRGLLLDADKRPLLRLLPRMDEVCRGYAIAHLGDIEIIANQVWVLNATDWLMEQKQISRNLCKDLAFSGFNRVLHEFAIKIAEDSLRSHEKQGGQVLKTSWELLKVKRRWMEGEISDKELDDARAALGAAYRAADWAAYWATHSAADWATHSAADWAADRAAERFVNLTAYWAAVRAVDWAAYWAADGAADGAADLAADRAADRVVNWAVVRKNQMNLLGDMLEDSAGLR